MTALIPGTHFEIVDLPSATRTFRLRCTICGVVVTRVASLSAVDGMEEHYAARHEEDTR